LYFGSNGTLRKTEFLYANAISLAGYFLRALTVLTEELRPTVMERPLLDVEELFFDCVKLEPATNFTVPILASLLRTLEALLAEIVLADFSASFTVILPHTGGLLIVRYFISIFWTLT